MQRFPVHAMKSYGVMETQVHPFLTSPLDSSGQSNAPSVLSSKKEPPVRIEHEVDPTAGLDALSRRTLLYLRKANDESQVHQPVNGYYTDCAINFPHDQQLANVKVRHKPQRGRRRREKKKGKKPRSTDTRVTNFTNFENINTCAILHRPFICKYALSAGTLQVETQLIKEK